MSILQSVLSRLGFEADDATTTKSQKTTNIRPTSDWSNPDNENQSPYQQSKTLTAAEIFGEATLPTTDVHGDFHKANVEYLDVTEFWGAQPSTTPIVVDSNNTAEVEEILTSDAQGSGDQGVVQSLEEADQETDDESSQEIEPVEEEVVSLAEDLLSRFSTLTTAELYTEAFPSLSVDEITKLFFDVIYESSPALTFEDLADALEDITLEEKVDFSKLDLKEITELIVYQASETTDDDIESIRSIVKVIATKDTDQAFDILQTVIAQTPELFSPTTFLEFYRSIDSFNDASGDARNHLFLEIALHTEAKFESAEEVNQYCELLGDASCNDAIIYRVITNQPELVEDLDSAVNIINAASDDLRATFIAMICELEPTLEDEILEKFETDSETVNEAEVFVQLQEYNETSPDSSDLEETSQAILTINDVSIRDILCEVAIKDSPESFESIEELVKTVSDFALPSSPDRHYLNLIRANADAFTEIDEIKTLCDATTHESTSSFLLVNWARNEGSVDEETQTQIETEIMSSAATNYFIKNML